MIVIIGPDGQTVMFLIRWVILLLLIAAGVFFALYLGTGQVRFRHLGLVVLKWTIAAGLVFFGVLILERIA